MASRHFHLRKWYLDLVTADGTAVIGYAARVRWGWLRARYGALLVSPPDGAAREVSTIRPGPEPEVGAESITWVCRSLALQGDWRPTCASPAITLIDGPAGAIRWWCTAPAADATLRIGPATWQGSGYVECLEMTIEPWRLPFRTLHWGHYRGGGHALVWILWDEGRAGAWASRNGVACADVAVADGAVRFGSDRTLELAAPRTLRAGPIVRALDTLPRLKRRVPAGFLGAMEEKWLSRAQYSEGSSGWSLHERVQLS